MRPLQYVHGAWAACPCGGQNLHHEWIKVFSRNEDEAEVTVTTVDNHRAVTVVERRPSLRSGNPSSRRDGLLIGFWCENCDTHSVLAISQHKGSTEIEWQGPA